MTPFLESAGWALMHFVWQGAAIAVLAAAALSRARADARRPGRHDAPALARERFGGTWRHL